MSQSSEHELDEQIEAAAASEGVCDVHEHLFSSRQRQERAPDLFGWISSSYLWADLVSAGMDRGLLGRPDLSADQKWQAIEPLLPAVRHTGYMEVCRHAWRDLCGMRGRHLDATNWRDVDAAIRTHNERPSFKEDVLVGRCGMKSIFVDYQVGGTAVHFFSQRDQIDWYRYLLCVRPKLSDRFIAERTIVRQMDLPCQHQVVKIDSLLYGWLLQASDENQQLLGANTAAARTLDQYSALIETVVRRCAELGAVGLKSAHNCCRCPLFGRVLEAQAGEALKLPTASMTPEHILAFENFAFQEIVRQAARYRLPLQIHTGTTFGPSGLSSAYAGSAHRFADLIQENPNTTFVLMHANWPHWGEIEQMAKRYPNVVLDLSWAVMLGPIEATRMLSSLLTSIPLSKILWGGDCCYAEESFGAYQQFRCALGRALSGLVSLGEITREEAVNAALQVLCRNSARFFTVNPRETQTSQGGLWPQPKGRTP